MKVKKSQLRKIIKEYIESDLLDSIDMMPVDDSSDKPRVMGNGGSAGMAKSQLFHIAKNAQSLHDKLNDEDQIPEWAQSKIAVMKSMLDAVYDHLDYKIHKSDK